MDARWVVSLSPAVTRAVMPGAGVGGGGSVGGTAVGGTAVGGASVGSAAGAPLLQALSRVRTMMETSKMRVRVFDLAIAQFYPMLVWENGVERKQKQNSHAKTYPVLTLPSLR